jgi:hypothetical protein
MQQQVPTQSSPVEKSATVVAVRAQQADPSSEELDSLSDFANSLSNLEAYFHPGDALTSKHYSFPESHITRLSVHVHSQQLLSIGCI